MLKPAPSLWGSPHTGRIIFWAVLFVMVFGVFFFLSGVARELNQAWQLRKLQTKAAQSTKSANSDSTAPEDAMTDPDSPDEAALSSDEKLPDAQPREKGPVSSERPAPAASDNPAMAPGAPAANMPAADAEPSSQPHMETGPSDPAMPSSAPDAKISTLPIEPEDLTQAAASPWRQVLAGDGNGNKTTRKFEVGEEWKVTWMLGAPALLEQNEFSVSVYNEHGHFIKVLATGKGPGSDESFYHQAGIYYLEFDALVPYTYAVWTK